MKLRLNILFLILFFFLNSAKSQNTDTVPKFFYNNYYHKDLNLLMFKSRAVANPFLITSSTQNSSELSLGDLNRSGSISRAITVGNNQNLSVNSSFNLQMSGRISEDLEIVAAISDDNIPIQPEGNTQQIQDFDRVFIQLINPNYTITAGDYELRKPNSYFLNYLKKVQGATISTNYEFGNENYTKNLVSLSVAKGKYNRMIIQGVEGNQGPYRLRGLYDEQFIIVLAGTERVFIDGVLMTRGDNQDYTIDYNTAEIIFTPRRLITAYSRITVEFEYSDKNYSRTLSIINSEQKIKSWKLRFNFYNEQDSKNRPLLQELDDDKKRFMASDDYTINKGFYNSSDSVGFSDTEVRYKKIDSLGQIVFIYSTNPEDALYKLNFTEFGPNKGNYVLSQNLANGRVFRFVAPINGVPQGTHEPLTYLVAPRKSRFYNIAAEKSFKALTISNEFAISDFNDNLFNTNSNTAGIGNKLSVSHLKKLKKDSTRTLNLRNTIQFEVLSDNFRFIEFYRPVEFNRDYNTSSFSNNLSKEYWLTYGVNLEKNEETIVSYRFSNFNKNNLFNGFQNQLNTNLSVKKIKIISSASINSSKDEFNNRKSTFLKHKIDLSYAFENLSLGLIEETEQNFSKNINNDSLTLLSFLFRDYRVYIASPEKWINKYRFELMNRYDELPFNNDMLAASRAQGFNALTELNKNKNSLFSAFYNYRKIEIVRTNTNQQTEDNHLLRLNHDARFKNGFVTANTFYEINTGREPKRLFTYIQVPLGQGVYVHRDYNNNGIKEINEFEIAKYSYEADYIRVSIVNSDFVRTKGTTVSQNLIIDFSRIWSNENGIKKFISNFSNQLNYKIERKVLFQSNESTFNPFNITIVDTNLISLNTQFRESIYFKRNDPIYGLEYTVQSNNSKSFLALGFDTRYNLENILRTRLNLFAMYSINTETKFTRRNANNEAATERNYQLELFSIEPEFAVQYNVNWRIALKYKYQKTLNKIGLLEQSLQNSLGTELKYNSGGKSSLTINLNYINNDFNGNSNSAIAYEMLEALQVGRNITWAANWQRNISATFQLNIVYEGRSSENASTINTGSMQVRAFF